MNRLVVVALLAVACRGKEPAREQVEPAREQVEPAGTDSWNTPRAEPDARELPRASAVDYAEARRQFRTKLVRTGPSPQLWQPLEVVDDARELRYESDGHKLRAWVSPASKTRRPAVVFLHGGFAFGLEDWRMTKPFRDAGYVVMVPILRGENGSPGAFSLYHDEVNDVLAATTRLAQRADVDPKRIFVTGHSAGGSLAALAALASKQFRASAPLSGFVDASAHAEDEALTPFDTSNAEEMRMRSAVVFAASFKCPTRLYLGEQEAWARPVHEETARRAKAAGHDVEVVIVPGDHHMMLDAAIPAAIAFFDQHR